MKPGSGDGNNILIYLDIQPRSLYNSSSVQQQIKYTLFQDCLLYGSIHVRNFYFTPARGQTSLVARRKL